MTQQRFAIKNGRNPLAEDGRWKFRGETMKICVIGKRVRAALILNILIAPFLFATSAAAASVSYVLDQSNALPDGVEYLQVTISDSDVVEGDIDFMVELISDALPMPGDNFGMQSFYLNVEAGVFVSAANISIDSGGWSVNDDRNAGGAFGKYDVALKGKGNSRVEILTFSIGGIDDDTIYSYALGSSLNPSSGEYFAAHVAGFSYDPYGVSSGKFAGSSPIPVPPAALLFASALGALGWRKRKTA